MRVGRTLGVIGGGQLARMMAENAAPLGIELVVLDPTQNAPAAAVVREQIVADFDDVDAIHSLALQVDALTYEIELADADALARVSDETGTPVHPHPDTLRTTQDKLAEKRSLAASGVPVPRFRAVETAGDLRAACDELGYPAMVKARRGGYDGRGNVPISSPDEAEACLDTVGGAPALVEEFVEYVRELSVIGVRGPNSDHRVYPPAENIHENEILRESVVPARTSDDVIRTARDLGRVVLGELDGRGVVGIELFETSGGDLLVNEIAPRPHNSGHWTIEGAVTSQFEQHVRAVLGAPLGSTSLRSPIVTSNILGDVETARPAEPTGIRSVLATDDVKLHWYGKREVRPLRKMGHLAVYGEARDSSELLADARSYRDRISFLQ